MSAEDEEIWCECSDDEKYNPAHYKKGTWEPKPDDILRIFEEIKTKKILELHWKCPGRRSPDSDQKKAEDVKEEPKEEEKEEEKKPEVTQFDFDYEGPEPKTVLTPRRTPGSAPKSEKKVARMDKVLKDMMYQRKLQAAEKEARKLTLTKSPRTPGSPGRARLGSPAGSPRTPIYGSSRQSPVRAPGPSESLTTTPVRGPGPSEGLATTPVRAPVSADTVVRTSISEAISAAASGAEPSVSQEFSRETVTNVDSSRTATPSEKNILSGETMQENSKSEEKTIVTNILPVMTSAVTSVTSAESPAPVVEQISQSKTSASEDVTQTTGEATPANQDKNTDSETPVSMDTT